MLSKTRRIWKSGRIWELIHQYWMQENYNHAIRRKISLILVESNDNCREIRRIMHLNMTLSGKTIRQWRLKLAVLIKMLHQIKLAISAELTIFLLENSITLSIRDVQWLIVTNNRPRGCRWLRCPEMTTKPQIVFHRYMHLFRKKHTNASHRMMIQVFNHKVVASGKCVLILRKVS